MIKSGTLSSAEDKIPDFMIPKFAKVPDQVL
jgi:hypothetical protein